MCGSGPQLGQPCQTAPVLRLQLQQAFPCFWPVDPGGAVQNVRRCRRQGLPAAVSPGRTIGGSGRMRRAACRTIG
eukprot:360395-Chlamydomonas_euryale.AAC.1